MRTFVMVVAIIVLGAWAVDQPTMLFWVVAALTVLGGGMLLSYLESR